MATRIQEAIEQAFSDCGYALLQATVSEAVEALLKRNEPLSGKMVIAEVMALIPLVRRYVKWRLASGHIKSSKALDELLDALTDKKLAAFFAARTKSFAFFVIRTPAELKSFLKRHPELDACEMQVHGSYIVISFRNNESGQEIMVVRWGGAAADDGSTTAAAPEEV